MNAIAPSYERMPRLDRHLEPPTVLGVAALASAMMAGVSTASLGELIERTNPAPVAQLFDWSVLSLLTQDRARGLALQTAALSVSPIVRIARPASTVAPIRLLALCLPGDLMVNTPVDFLTAHADIRLDILFLVPGQALPNAVPDHDVMLVAGTATDAPATERLVRLHASWPRPVLNDPALLSLLTRDRLPARLREIDTVCCPTAASVDGARLRELANGECDVGDVLPECGYPILVRPAASHAGHGLEKIDNALDLERCSFGDGAHFLTGFVDYRSADGLFRKLRVVFIEGKPHLAHMAVSSHWMVHYLNAGMDSCAAKRAEEEAAMANFTEGFATRHRRALAAVHELLPFDYFSIDCAETADGRLLVFEADTAAIVHMMDPPAIYPYKRAYMPRIFNAFEAMLRGRAQCERESDAPQPLTPIPALTGRQRDVLDLLLEGQSTKQIAQRLDLGLGTVKVHLHELYRRLGTSDRAETVALFRPA